MKTLKLFNAVVTKKYMMNPNNLFMEAKCESVQKQMILGLLLQESSRQAFVLLNMGAGSSRVSGNSEIATLSRVALTQEWSNPLSFNKIVESLGAEIVEEREDADVDLSLNTLERDSFTKIFELGKSKVKKQAVLLKV